MPSVVKAMTGSNQSCCLRWGDTKVNLLDRRERPVRGPGRRARRKKRRKGLAALQVRIGVRPMLAT